MIWTNIQDRARKVGYALGFIAIGAWGSNIANRTATLPRLHEEADSVPHLVAEVKEANCDRSVAVRVAKQAIASTETDAVATPAPSDLKPCARPKK